MNLSMANECIKYAIDNSLLSVNLENGDVLRGNKVLTQSIDNRGYLRIGFVDPRCKIKRTLYVHRIIGYVLFGDKLFLDDYSIDHVNGIATDNRFCNIAIMPRGENTAKSAAMTRGWYWVIVDYTVIATCKHAIHADEIAKRENGSVVFAGKHQ